MFKRILMTIALAASALLTAEDAKADVYIRGYHRSNGTYLAPHYRSNPDSSFHNNWSTFPNINPHTGRMGTQMTPPARGSESYRTPSPSYPTYRPFGSPRLGRP